MARHNRFIRWCITIILVLIIIYLGSLVDFIFKPILSLFSMSIIPLMLAGFFYYLLRPLVGLMERRKVNRTLAILFIYLAFAIIIIGFSIWVWPSLRTQLINLVDSAPTLFTSLRKQVEELERNGFLSSFLPQNSNLLTKLTEYLNKGFTLLTEYFSGLLTFFSNFAIVLITFPILLFYMLKEGGKFGEQIVRFIPKRFRHDGGEVMDEIDHMLSSFIVGRVIVNVALGVLMYIGFLIIDLPYALLLTVVAVILNFIPFIGSFLSSVPIVIIGFIESPSIAIWSIVIITIAQQIQDNLIGPYVFGKQLDIHPLTTILLVLVGGDIGGILGILLIIPIYMILKIVYSKVYVLFFKQRWENA
ncbi:AI-2E family transporter [Paenibacillus sp. FSL H8-0548]|uniref:AI-2E family transporter n=1 Tax=Paenibacillus sp. FSL H8-0548 TaxID=1920422 RepID=UPI00096F3B1D|nr:AI-2E family transporter [Paenibacillus sp. FSL H8-0548]OMF37098.1 AI-2E family transporter [Paenibacillus sp. FSL H8-0548]